MNGLPNRRALEVFDVAQDGHLYRVGVGRFEDGSPAEVHIDSPRPGSHLDTHGRDIAALITLLLQSGVGISTIKHSLHSNPGASLADRVVRLIGCVG
jgi:hypothetical protein